MQARDRFPSSDRFWRHPGTGVSRDGRGRNGSKQHG